MKFILLVSAAVVAAGGGAYLLTEQPAAEAASLVGDWRCNTKATDNNGAFDGSLLMSIAATGATKGQALFNSPMRGHMVTVEAIFTGQTRVERGLLHETTSTAVITEATVDGAPVPADLRKTLRDQILSEAETYKIEEFSGSRLVYANEMGKVTCERSPVPLKL